MKQMLKLILPLTVIAAVCAALLALVDAVTRGPIADIATLRANAAARAVMPATVTALDVRCDPADTNVAIVVGYADASRAKPVAYAVPGVSPNGYGGDIRLMVGLDAAGAVVTYRVLAANETPGLGSKLGDVPFVAQFAGRPAATLKVKKDGGDVDAITGATITSRAVCAALADAAARVARLEGRATAPAPKTPAVLEGTLILDPAKPETARKVLPRATATVVERAKGPRFPIFEGRDAAGAVTGYAVVGTGTGRGPDGTIAVHCLYGFTPQGALARTTRPLPVNRLDISTADMISAQAAALNAALRDATEQVRALGVK